MMPPSPDSTSIPIGIGCEVAGESRQNRSNWLDRDLIGGSKRGSMSLEDLRDLAAVAELVRLVPFDVARIAWVQVRDATRASWEAPILDVVLDMQLKEATLATGLDEVAQAVRSRRPMRVIPLAGVIAEATEAFHRIEEALRATEVGAAEDG